MTRFDTLGGRQGAALVAVAGALLCVVTSAHAQPSSRSRCAPESGVSPWSRGVSPERQKRARALHRAGNQALESGLISAAVSRYEEALEYWRNPGTHLSLATAQILQDRPLDAFLSLERALAYGRAPYCRLNPALYTFALAKRTEMRGRIGELQVHSFTRGALVAVDGTRLNLAYAGPGRPFQHTLWVRAGRHQVIAKKAGHITVSRSLVVAPGATYRIELDLVPLEQSRPPVRWRPWAALGASAALGITGGVLHWRARVDEQRYDAALAQECPIGCLPEERPRSVVALQRRAASRRTLAVVADVFGVVGIVSSLVWIARAPPTPRRPPALRIVPMSGAVFGSSLQFQF